MRQVSEARPDMFDRAGGLNSIMTAGISNYSKPQYFGKFRAYLFVNAFFLAVGMLVTAIILLSQGETEAALGSLVFMGLLLGIGYLLWHGVEKKVAHGEKRLVFWSLFATGIFIFAKILLFMTIILIPLALKFGGEYEPEYKYVESGLFSGKYVLVRRKANGQLEDNYGNLYED